MTGGPDPRLPARVAGIAAAVAVMAALVAMVVPGLAPAEPPRPFQPGRLAPPEVPIAAEADVFRTRPGDLAADPGAARRPEAHPRTVALYRRVRAFPGAPPRIPHGLTTEEFKGGRCVVCHERGGFVERFAAYAPVTPHPELSQCLQCHVPDDDLVGLPFTADPPAGPVCFQCHVLDRATPMFVEIDWPEPEWPPLTNTAPGDAPPPIPHDLRLRGNCLACHMGAAAIAAIRTGHPERAACRQCHVAAGDPEATPAFARQPARTPAADGPTGGAP